MKRKIMISACLLGKNCKYNGGNNENPAIIDFLKAHDIVPICPEVFGGLRIPHPASEIRGGKVVSKLGEDVDAAFRKGAEKCVEIARRENIDFAVLKSRSPSCGVKQIYDGTFSGTVIDGMGVAARALFEAGFDVRDSEEFEKLILSSSAASREQ